MADEWSEIGENVFVRRHERLDLNVGLVVGDGACLLVDTRGSEADGRELADAVRRVTPHPWTVVNTHAHYDHCFGNAAFRPGTIWGHRRVPEILTAKGEGIRRRVATAYREAGMDDVAAEVEASRIDPPDRTMETTQALDVGGVEVVLRFLGRGHTDHDVIIQLPATEVLFAGDLVEEGAPPQFASAWPMEWPGTLDALLPLATGRVVPGHGAVVDRAYVAGQRDELAAAADLARDGHAAGKPVEEVAAGIPYLGEFAAQAVGRVYKQLSEGAA